MKNLELQVVSFIVAITIHEAAHAFAAYKLGDTTAKDEGRLSLNPMEHIDPFGTVILPIMLMMMNAPVFGWAKPVPIDTRGLKDPKTAEYWIAIAGPFSNFLLALLIALFYHGLSRYGYGLLEKGYLSEGAVMYIYSMIGYMLSINLVLCIFNLIPIPPLDGFHVVRSMLPDDMYENLNVPPGVGFLLFIILMSTGVTDEIITTFYYPLLNFLLGKF